MAQNVADLLWKMFFIGTGTACMWGARHQVERKSRVVQNIEQQEALAKQVLNGRLDTVIKTIEHNVRLV
jgi:hypothetical protein